MLNILKDAKGMGVSINVVIDQFQTQTLANLWVVRVMGEVVTGVVSNTVLIKKQLFIIKIIKLIQMWRLLHRGTYFYLFSYLYIAD